MVKKIRPNVNLEQIGIDSNWDSEVRRLTRKKWPEIPVVFLSVGGTCLCVASGVLASCSGFVVPGLLTIVSGGAGYVASAYQCLTSEVTTLDRRIIAEMARLQKEVGEIKAKLAVLQKERSEPLAEYPELHQELLAIKVVLSELLEQEPFASQATSAYLAKHLNSVDRWSD